MVGTCWVHEKTVVQSFHLQPIAHAGARLGRILGVGLGALLHLRDILLGTLAVGSVRLDGLLAVRCQLRLPVALALLLLREQILLVLLWIPRVVGICSNGGRNVCVSYCFFCAFGNLILYRACGMVWGGCVAWLGSVRKKKKRRGQGRRLASQAIG